MSPDTDQQTFQPHESRKKIYEIVFLVLLGAAVGYFATAQKKNFWPFRVNEPVMCTEEAKLCPDGSYVGRTGPSCEFAKCPGEININDWNAYRNTKYGFEIYYPKRYPLPTISDGLTATDVTGTDDAPIFFGLTSLDAVELIFFSFDNGIQGVIQDHRNPVPSLGSLIYTEFPNVKIREAATRDGHNFEVYSTRYGNGNDADLYRAYTKVEGRIFNLNGKNLDELVAIVSSFKLIGYDTELNGSKTHHSRELNYEISYPKDWFFNESFVSWDVGQSYFQIYNYDAAIPKDGPGSDESFSADILKVEAFFSDNKVKSLESWIGQNEDSITKTENLMMNGKPMTAVWREIENPQIVYDKYIQIYYWEGDRGIVFGIYPYNTSLFDEAKSIISTFKFIK